MQKPHEVILGIDPGTRITGYGIIEKKNPLGVVDYGCITPPPKLPLAQRYWILFTSIDALITRYRPTAIGVETQFIHKNVKSAMKLGMAKGIVLLLSAKHKIPLFEYAPTKAKLAVVGSGRASKIQVQKMIQAILALSEMPEPEDAADALAIAICHAHEEKLCLSM